MVVREATPDDIDAMGAIYAHHVRVGFGSFEETPPERDAFAERVSGVQALGLPWLVAEIAGHVVGYAYSSSFRPRSGYRYTVEDSVYVDPAHAGQGVGRALLEAVIERCRALGLRQMAAVIGDSGNTASMALHRGCGFEMAGVFRSVGFKHGRWVDIVLMQRALNDGDATPPQGRGWLAG